jgi:BioD-like phosphotransacetylase family protein
MANALYLVSPRTASGKNLLALTLGKDAQQRGKRLAYFKPVGPFPVRVDGKVTDQDALTVAQALGLSIPPDVLCPVPLTEELHRQVLAGTVPDLLPHVKEAFADAARDAEFTLISGMGNLFSSGTAYGLTASTLAEQLEAHVLLSTSYERERTEDEVLAAQQLFGNRLLGIVLHDVRPNERTHVMADVVPFFERKGMPVFGSLPEDPILHSISVSEIADALNARVLVGEEHLDELVERFAIGAMNEEAALSHFRKVTNKAVITGGDRSDVQRAALETSTKVLILTGGIYPANVILSAAMERQTPVLLVWDDTLTTIERLEALTGRPRLRQPAKLERAVQLFREHTDLNRLWQAVGL